VPRKFQSRVEGKFRAKTVHGNSFFLSILKSLVTLADVLDLDIAIA